FLLFEGSELLHRSLYDARIKHEYHLVLGADHLGRTVRPRSMEALQFLTRVLMPPLPDAGAGPTRKKLAPLKAKAGVKQTIASIRYASTTSLIPPVSSNGVWARQVEAAWCHLLPTPTSR